MKKYLFIMLMVVSLLTASTSTILAGSALNIEIDGTPVVFNENMGYPYIENGRTFVPVRVISEGMGYGIEWVDKTRTVYITAIVNGERVYMNLTIGKTVAKVDGLEVQIDESGKIAPIIKNGRTYVPLRFISENMKAEVSWDEASRTVSIVPKRGKVLKIPEWQLFKPGPDPGVADFRDDVGNVEKLKAYMNNWLMDGFEDGPNLVVLNPFWNKGRVEADIGSGATEEFLTIYDNETALLGETGEEVEINVAAWLVPDYWASIPYENRSVSAFYEPIPEITRTVLEFYLPNGGGALTDILHKGFVGELTKAEESEILASSDLAKSHIPSDGRRVTLEVSGKALKVRITR